MRPNAFRLAIALLLAPLAVIAHEWDSTWGGASAPTNYFDEINYRQASPLAGRPGWIIDDVHTATRVSATGEVLAQVVEANSFLEQVLRNLPNGDAITAGGDVLRRVDANGRQIWWQRAIGMSHPLAPRNVAADDTGSVWYFTSSNDRLYKIGPSGQQMIALTASALGLRSFRSIAVAASGRQVLVTGLGGTTAAPAVVAVRLSRNGEALSTWIGPHPRSEESTDSIALFPAEDYAVSATIDDRHRLVVARHNTTGSTTLPQTPATLDASTVIDFIKPTTGGFVVFVKRVQAGQAPQQSVHYFAASGAALASRSLPESFVAADHTSAQGADGSLWAVARLQGAAAPLSSQALFRFIANAETRIAMPAALGSRLAFIAASPNNDGALIAEANRLYRVNPVGAVTQLTRPSVIMPMTRVLGTTTNEGISYVVQKPWEHGSAAAGHTISRIGRDGATNWSVPLPLDAVFSISDFAFDSARIAANTDRLCYHATVSNTVYCHDAANGNLLKQVTLPAGRYDALALDAANRVLLYRLLGGAAPVAALDANLVALPTSAYTASMLAPGLYHPNGYEFYFDGVVNNTASVIRREARVTQAPTPAVSWQLGGALRPLALANGQPALRALADGSALLLVATGTAQIALQKLNADGTLGFRRTFDDAMHADLVLVNDRVVVSTHLEAVNFSISLTTLRLAGVSLADGSVAWQRRLDFNDANGYGNGAANPIVVDGDHVQWWWTDYRDYVVEKVRVTDGSVVARSDLLCTLKPCNINRLQIHANGATLLPEMALRARSPFDASVRADQDRLEGSWYQPSTSGQGVLFDYLPEARTWFGTWHTTLLGGINDDDELRWFTLQGTVSNDNSMVDLGIYRAIGGVFNSAPSVPSQRIGDARLSFDTCGSANLEYRFTGGEWQNASGAIPLRALLPRSECAALGGAITPVIASERGGIGSRHTGTWYAPATSGQGVEASIRPDVGSGLVFAGWFTFDPQGAADDATAQHWFTLQGDLSTAANGSVTLQIFRSTGGSFDETGTRNTWRVGEATWTFTSCDRSTLQYRFDTSEVAGTFSARTGTLQLQRLGACSMP